MNCKYCSSPLEFDTHIRDEYQWWCANCHACYNDAGKPQPGMMIWYRVPDEPAPDQQAIKEAVIQAAVRIFTPSEVGLMFMPSAAAKQDLKAAVKALLASGWQSLSGDKNET